MNDITEISDLIRIAKDRNLSVKDISDGYHTFRELYKLRMILFSIICNAYKDFAWKSKKHFDEDNDPMFNGWD